MPTALKIRAFRIAQRLRRAFTPKQRAHRAFTLPELRGQHAFTVKSRGRFAFTSPRRARRGFSLVELLIVMGIIVILTALLAPAFTSLKSAGDVTSAAYTIKGVLEQARTYAMANSTYTWVGFAGSVGSTVTGQVSLAIVASNDGTQLGTDSTGTSPLVVGTGTGTMTQVSKLTRLDNAHIGDTGVPTNDGTEFEGRPNVAPAYRVFSSGDTVHPFTVQQTTFNRWIQFSPRGEPVVKGGGTQIAPYAEIVLLPTHGSVLGVTPNIAAIQISGFGGNVRIYRR
jgi:prepilin-type N-terminal cleavage/methylation domain-containing protein